MTPEAARLIRIKFFIPQLINGTASYWIPNSWTNKVSVEKRHKQIQVNGNEFYSYQVIKLIIQSGKNHPYLEEDESVIRTAIQSIGDQNELKLLDVEIIREEKKGDTWYKVQNGHIIQSGHKITILIAFEDNLAGIARAFACLKESAEDNGWTGVYSFSTNNTDVYYECDVRNAAVHIFSQLDPEWLKLLSDKDEYEIHLLLHLDAVGKPDISFLSLIGFDSEGRNIFKKQKAKSVCFPTGAAAIKDTKCFTYVQHIYKSIIEAFHNCAFKIGGCKATFKISNTLFEIGDRALLKLFTGVLVLVC